MRDSNGTADAETGRYRQRQRTRDAIVAATAELVRAGDTPSINEIADAAGVSRRTIYQYFPTLEQLLLDATVGLLSQQSVDEAIERADRGEDAAYERVHGMIRAFGAMQAETLPLGRKLIRLTVDARPDATDGPRRGYRRVGWIERALEPVRDQVDDAAYERLVSALTVMIGWVALIVLDDVRGLATAEQTSVATWAADVLIRATLDEHAR
jgi:AcrR family transcriptional regulator